MISLLKLRAQGWSTVPSGPGIYWWYFDPSCLSGFRIDEFCGKGVLSLRRSAEGKVCLYHGMAKSLSQRVKWHGAQKLTPGSLRTGFLSTFRFTLLALKGFDYLAGEKDIDSFMNGLDLHWQETGSVSAAKAAEAAELGGTFRYPLNIQDNRHPELSSFTLHLKALRKSYKQRYI